MNNLSIKNAMPTAVNAIKQRNFPLLNAGQLEKIIQILVIPVFICLTAALAYVVYRFCFKAKPTIKKEPKIKTIAQQGIKNSQKLSTNVIGQGQKIPSPPDANTPNPLEVQIPLPPEPVIVNEIHESQNNPIVPVHNVQENIEEQQTTEQQTDSVSNPSVVTKEQEIAHLIHEGKGLVEQKNFIEASKKFEAVLSQQPQNVEALLLYGNTLVHQGYLVQAKRHYNQILDIEPENIDALMNCGRIERKKRQLTHAEEYFNAALRLNPTHIPILNGLGKCYSLAWRSDEATQYFQKVLELNPNHLTAKIGLGKTLARNTNTADYYAPMTQLYGENSKVWLAYGSALLRDYQFIQAEQAFRQAIDLSPKNIKPCLLLIRFLIEENRYEEAESCIQKALEIEPHHLEILQFYQDLLKHLPDREEDLKKLSLKMVEVLHTLAKQFLQKNEQTKVEDFFRTILDIDPDHIEALIGVGKCEWKRQDTHSARKNFEKALKQAPDSLDALNGLGKIQTYQGDIRNAAITFNRVLGLYPGNLAARLYLGKTLHSDTEKMVQYYKEVLEDHPQNSRVWLYYGKSHYQNGNFEEADKAFKKAIEFGPHDFKPVWMRASLAFEERDYEKAKEYYEKAVALSPPSSFFWSTYQNFLISDGRRLMTQKKINEAETQFKKVLKIDLLQEDALYYCGYLYKKKLEEASFSSGIEEETIKVWKETALHYLNQLLKTALYHQDARILVHEINEKSNTEEEVEKSWKSILQDYSTNAKVWCRYAIYLEKQGKLEDSKKASLKALDLDSYSRPTLRVVSRVLGKLGEYKEAEKYIRQALAWDQDNLKSLYILQTILTAQGNRSDELKELSTQIEELEIAAKNLSTI